MATSRPGVVTSRKTPAGMCSTTSRIAAARVAPAMNPWMHQPSRRCSRRCRTMNHPFAPVMPTTMATSVTVHQGPSARWSPAITRAWSASATAMPSVTIAPQMPGKIPGTRAKGVGQVLTCAANSADGAHLRQNRAVGRSGPAAGVAFPCSLGPCAG